jgi:hypothetical protein
VWLQKKHLAELAQRTSASMESSHESEWLPDNITFNQSAGRMPQPFPVD